MDEEEKLKSLRDKREKAEYEYDRVKKMFSQTSDYEEAKRKRAQRLMSKDEIIADPRIREIYEERIDKAKQYQINECEFHEAYEREWRKLNEEMDAEEKELLDALDEKNEDDKEADSEEKNKEDSSN